METTVATRKSTRKGKKQANPTIDQPTIPETPVKVELTSEQREYKRLRAYAATQVSPADWAAAVKALAGEAASPEVWLQAARDATVECPACQGTGKYSAPDPKFGNAIIAKGDCYRCIGKGVQGQYNFRTNYDYDSKHAR